MSETIDNRVVQMQFNNQQFEAGIKDSLGSLDRLKKGLELDGATKSLMGLGDAAKKFSLAGIAEGVDKISSKFTALGIMGVTALQNITNAALNAGSQMLKSLTIAPISDGFSEYELVLNALQTTMAGTGKSMEDVEKELQRLDEYADNTVYSTKDMLASLPKFTNAGVALEPAITAMIGIANATALAGGGAQQASMAFYNLGQSIGTGYLTRMDYNSINLAGIATMEWKNQMIDAAIAQGKLKKAGEDSYEVNGKLYTLQSLFIDGLQEQWASTDVLMKVFGDYGDVTTEIGEKAQAAAQDIKTFTQLMETLKAAAGTGWKTTWDSIFGNLEEAKSLWTGIGTAIGDYIKAGADARNQKLDYWKDNGGREAFITGLANSLKILSNIIRPIEEAFREIFPASTGQTLVDLSEKFMNFTSKLVDATKDMDGFKSTFKGIFAVVSIVIQVVKAVAKGIGEFISAILPAGEGISNFTGKIGDWLVKLNEAIKKGDLFNKAIQKMVEFIKPVIAAISGFLSAVVDAFINFDFSSISTFASTIKDKLGPLGKFFEGIGNVFKKIAEFFKPAIQAIGKVFAAIGKKIKEGFENLTLDDVFKTGKAIKNGAFAGIFAAIAIQTEELIRNFKKITKTAKTVLQSFKGILDSVSGYIKSGTLENVSKAMRNFAVAIAIVAASVFLLSLANPDRLVSSTAAMTVIITELLTALKMIKQYTTDKDSFNNIGRIVLLLVGLAVSANILASALIKLSTLDWKGVGVGLTGLTVMLAELVAITKILEKNEKGLVKEAIGFAAVGAALLIIAQSIKAFGEMDQNVLIQGGVAVTVLLAALTGMGAALQKNTGFKATTGLGFLAIAGALRILASVVTEFGAMDIKTLVQGMSGVIVVLASFAGFTQIVKSDRLLTVSIAMSVMSVALLELLGVIKLFGLMDLTEMAKGILGMAGMLAVIAGFTRLVRTDQIISLSAALVIMSAGLLALAGVMKILGSMSVGELVVGLLALAGVFAVVGGAAAILKPLVPTIFALSAGIALLGVGIALLGVGTLAFAQGLLLLSGGAVTAAAAIVVLGTAVASLIPIFVIAIGEGIIAFAGVVRDGAPVIADAFIALVHAGLESFKTIIPDVVDTVFDLILEILSTLDEKIPEIIDKLFSIVIGLLKKVADNLPELIKTGAELIKAFFDGVMQAIGTFDGATLLDALGAMAAVFAILTLFAASSAVALTGILGMTAVLAALGGIKQIPGLEWLINQGSDFINLIGSTLGEFVGSIIGGALDKISDSFPDLATKLSMFMTNLKPFLEGAQLITKDMTDGLVALVGVILLITASSVIDALTSWLTGGSSIVKFGEDLAEFGRSYAKYYDRVSGIKPDVVEASANAAKVLADFADAVPNMGGLSAVFSGENSLARFGVELVIFGSNLAKYGEKVKGIDAGTIIASANAGKILTEMATQAPKWGGVGSWFAGENKLSTFGPELVAFGSSLKEYSKKVVGLNPDAVLASANAGKILSEMAAQVPNWGGVGSWFAGDNDLSTFGEDLELFGVSLKKYGDNIAGLDTKAVMASASAGEILSKMADQIPNWGGIGTWFTGDNKLSTFGEDLVIFGSSLKNYSEIITGLDSEAVTTSANAASMLTTMADQIPKWGGIGSWFSGDNSLSGFGENLVKFAEALVDYGDIVDDVKSEVVAEATAQISKIVDLAKMVSEVDTGKMYEFITAMTDVALQSVSSFNNILNNSEWDVTAAVDAMIGYAVDEATAKGTEFESIGQNAINGITTGMKSLEKEPAKVIVDIMTAAIGAIKEYLDINSPSKRVRKEIAEPIVEGLIPTDKHKKGVLSSYAGLGRAMPEGIANGVEEKADTAGNALWEMLGNTGDQMIAALNPQTEDSPVAAAEEVGNAIPDAVATGITNNESPEEAMKKKAEAIIEAFKEAIDEADLGSTTVGLEEKLWEALYGDSTSENGQLSKKMEFLDEKIMFQQDKLAAAEGEYKQMLDTFGADATETKESYNRYLQAQVDLAELIKQKKELLNQAKNANSAAVDKYWEILTDEKLLEAIKNGWLTQEELEKYAREQSGYDPNAVAQEMGDEATSALGVVTDAYRSGLNKMFGEGLMKTFTEFGGLYATSLVEGFLEKFKGVITKIEGAFIALEEKTISRMGIIIAAIQEALDNADFTITVRPVLDMSEITAQFNAINGQKGKLIHTSSLNSALIAGYDMPSKEIVTPSNQNGSQANGTKFEFNQFNYSPKELSRLELYRQTRNQFSQLKGLVTGV